MRGCKQVELKPTWIGTPGGLIHFQYGIWDLTLVLLTSFGCIWCIVLWVPKNGLIEGQRKLVDWERTTETSIQTESLYTLEPK